MSDIRVVLLVLGLFPGVVLAQSTELQPPPLIGVEDVAEAEAESVPPEALPSRPAAEVEWAPEPPGRVAGRVLLESMGGAVGGVGGAFVGMLSTLPFGGLSIGCDGDSCDGSGLVGGALVGWSLGAALGVYGSGTLLEGRGRFLPTVGLGLLAGGASAGLYMSEAVGDGAVPLLIILPLATSIITYEVTSSWNQPGPRVLAASRGSGAWWTPTVGVSQRGGTLGLMGRF